MERSRHPSTWGRDPLGDEDPRYVDLLVGATRPFRALYRWLGVDYVSMGHLLRAKLLLEHRRRKRRDGSPGLAGRTGLILMLLLYVVLGSLLGTSAFVIEDPGMFLTIAASAALFFLVLPILLDFSSVLLDTTDVALLAPLPVADRLVVAVRVTHISLYVSSMAASLGLGPLILGTIAYRSVLYPPILLLGLFQMAVLALSAVVVLYLVALKSLDLSRFRDAMIYLQTGAFLLFYAVTQLGPQLSVRLGLDEWLMDHPLILCAWPPASVGALGRLGLGSGGSFDGWVLLSGWAATAATVILGALLARRGFVTRLATMEAAGGSPRGRPRRRGITGRLGAHLAGGGLERAGWDFFIHLSASERIFKLRVMPLGVLAVMPLFMITIRSTDAGMGPLLALLVYLPYVPLLIVPSIWETGRFSEKWGASVVLDILSGEERQRFVRGALRAVYVRFLVLPVLLIVSIAAWLIDRGDLVGLLLSTAVALAGGAWALPRFGGFVPFTAKFGASDAQSNTVVVILGGVVTVALGVVQWGLGRIPFVLPVLAVLAVALILPAWRRLGRVKLRTRGRFEYAPY